MRPLRAGSTARAKTSHRNASDEMLRAIVTSRVLKGSAAAFTIKLAAALLGFTMFALMSRRMQPAEFGSLAIIFNTMASLSAAALCGQETLIVRSWDEYCR